MRKRNNIIIGDLIIDQNYITVPSGKSAEFNARKFKLVSEHGNYMDPLADKVLMIGTLSAFLYLDVIALWAFSIIVGRDIIITFYRN